MAESLLELLASFSVGICHEVRISIHDRPLPENDVAVSSLLCKVRTRTYETCRCFTISSKLHIIGLHMIWDKMFFNYLVV